jgi:hypothetical protein
MDKENGNRKRAQKRKSLPQEYKWKGQGAKTEKKKGKSPRGIIIGMKWGIKEKEEEDGCMERKVHIGNKWWKIMAIHGTVQ